MRALGSRPPDADVESAPGNWRERFDPDEWFLEPCEASHSLFGIEVAGVLHQESSPYQDIRVLECRGFGRTLVLDNVLMLTERDHFIYHEMLTHPALFTHADPRRVAIVGGGDCGCLREVLRHPGVESVRLVELDERVTRVAERFFPELVEGNSDPRASFTFQDAIEWMAQAPPESLDVILVDSTDPVGQAARLSGREFYEQCRRVLGAGGVLAAQSQSPFTHTEMVRNLRRNLAAAGFSRVSTLHFPQPTYSPGWWSVTLAGGEAPHEEFRAQDAQRRAFSTRYYNPAVHRGAMALPEFLRAALSKP